MNEPLLPRNVQRIHVIRQQLLDRVWLGVLVLALVGAPASASRALSTGWLPLYSSHVALAALVVALFLLRRRLSFMTRSVSLLAMFFLVGAAGIFTLGLLGAGLWWLVMTSLLASTLLSQRTGLVVSGVSLALIALAAVGFTRGVLKVPVDPAVYVYDVTSWVSFLIAAALLPFVVFQSIALFQRSTVDLIAEVEQQRGRFTDFAGIAADGFWETDSDLRLTYASQSFADALGLRQLDMLGRTPGEAYLLRFPDAPRIDEFMAPLRRHEEFSHLQFPVLDVQGRRALLACLGRPRFDAAGAFLGYRGVVRDITQLKQMENELRQLALLDPLTGMANRRRFNEKLAEAIQRSERTGQPLALMYLDLDGFKHVNDTLGHDVGDEILKEFGRRVVTCVRQTDTVCRLAGDEFAVILENLASAQDPERVALKIIAAMGPAAVLKTHEVPMSTSIGIALRGTGEMAGDALLKRADAALYQAKKAQRGSHAVAPA